MNALVEIVKSVLPFVGTALGGPLGAAAATFVAGKLGMSDSSIGAVSDAISTLVGNPDQIAKMKEIDNEFKLHLATLGYESIEKLEEFNTRNIEAVNKTMQSETISDHWPSYSWRPFCGFIFGVTFFGVYFVLPLAKLPIPTIPSEAWLAIGAVLGVASWFRGKMQADPNIPTTNKG